MRKVYWLSVTFLILLSNTFYMYFPEPKGPVRAMFRIFLESAHLSTSSKSFTVVYDALSFVSFVGSRVSIIILSDKWQQCKI